MKLVLALIRFVLAKVILALNALFPARAPRLSAEQKARLDQATRGMVLYEFEACPFCVRTRREAARLGLNIERRDAKRDPRAAEELLKGGGKIQVPCLKIEEGAGKTRWLYESSDIIEFLKSLQAPSELMAKG